MLENEGPGVLLVFDVDGVDEEGAQLFSSTSNWFDCFFNALSQYLGVVVGRDEGRFVFSIFLLLWCLSWVDMFEDIFIYYTICWGHFQRECCLHIFLTE